MSLPKFRVGDVVSWLSETGKIAGKVIDVHEMPFRLNSHRHNATQDDPHYEIACLKTGRVAYRKAKGLILERAAA
ncbi:DUF2945 domain-containing protein [Acetobacteraceae bacterium ESL0709]|nr:DUF2945 domain-containing protein [Acetobacteraceae bacterium ESL0697]MDF7677453.1 DUF2945 domain-containing protein [Acetobacteraceae bacterium ESL0709]